MKVERTHNALASASRDISRFVSDRRVNAATDLTRDETESRPHDPPPDHHEVAQGTQPEAHVGESEKVDRLLNITA
jgi:hypothetical protein